VIPGDGGIVTLESQLDFSNGVPHSAGGTLAQYAGHLQNQGQAAVLTADNTQLWFSDAKKTLLRLPLVCTQPVERDVSSLLLKQDSIWMFSYLQEPATVQEANCFHYVCDNKDYALEPLDKNIRRDIRRGGRSFEIRLLGWDELRKKGLSAWQDTDLRHGYTPVVQQDLDEMIGCNEGAPFYELWGAWVGDELAAWYQVIKIDNWAMINVACSKSDALRNCPNNALVYGITRRMMIEEKRDYVTYGLSSAQVFANESSMHRFKCKMGYTALSCKRRFAVHPLLRPVLTVPPTPQIWNLLARTFSNSEKLRKIAGLSNILSGHTPESKSADSPAKTNGK